VKVKRTCLMCGEKVCEDDIQCLLDHNAAVAELEQQGKEDFDAWMADIEEDKIWQLINGS